ncbi:MAG: glycosyltransferase family 4 protein [bacterium]|nr:glycosyltransferase family 4 protein [bacterium]
MYPPKEMIWITWENHRRTKELSNALGAPLFTLLYDGSYVAKVLVVSLKTVAVLLHIRPRRVIAQNPSMVLSALLCFLKPFLGYKVIVDRHSNFKFETQDSPKLRYRVFHYLSRYTVRKADLTIVTNEFLKGIVQKWGGRGFVLQDRLPELPFRQSKPPRLAGRHNITYICSFSDDEPVDEVLDAARSLDKSIVMHVTGNPRDYLSRVKDGVPENVVFTGFLPERDYQSLLGASDAIIALTRDEHLLLCGAYEAVSLGKPLILSDTGCVREYFRDGPIYTRNNGEDLAQAIRSAIGNRRALLLKSQQLRKRLQVEWTSRFRDLTAVLWRA